MSHILTDITHQYQAATSGWYVYLFPIASRLFGTLAIIELAWSAIWWTIDKKDISSLWGELTKKVITISFFYAILLNANNWLPNVIESFILAGAGAAHIQTLDPSSVLSQGVSIASSVFKPLGVVGLITSPLAVFVGVFTSLIVIVSFAMIAGFLVVSLVEAYIVVSAGVLMLGFSSSRFTSKFATGYLTYAFSVGAKLFTLYLIIGVGVHMAANWGEMLTNAGIKNLSPFFEVIGGALVYVFLAWSIPVKAESLISGASGATLTGLTAVSSTVSTATAGTAMMGARNMGGAVGGSMQAIKQAHTIAQGHEGGLVGGVAKGAAGASVNLMKSMVGSATGQHASTSASMVKKTSAIQQKQYDKKENLAANSKKVHPRPDNSEPPSSGTSNQKTQRSVMPGSGLPTQQTTNAPPMDISHQDTQEESS